MQVSKQLSLFVDEFLSKYQLGFSHNTGCSQYEKNANRNLTIVKNLTHS